MCFRQASACAWCGAVGDAAKELGQENSKACLTPRSLPISLTDPPLSCYYLQTCRCSRRGRRPSPSRTRRRSRLHAWWASRSTRRWVSKSTRRWASQNTHRWGAGPATVNGRIVLQPAGGCVPTAAKRPNEQCISSTRLHQPNPCRRWRSCAAVTVPSTRACWQRS